MSSLRDTIDAAGVANTASRTDGRSPGQASTVGSDFDANDFFNHYEIPQDGDSFGSHHLFNSLGGGYQAGMERNAAVYTVKDAGLFTTDNLAPRPEEAIPRTGREIRVGDGATGRDLISNEFDAMKMNDTSTIDDFRGLGKISAWRLYGVKE